MLSSETLLAQDLNSFDLGNSLHSNELEPLGGALPASEGAIAANLETFTASPSGSSSTVADSSPTLFNPDPLGLNPPLIPAFSNDASRIDPLTSDAIDAVDAVSPDSEVPIARLGDPIFASAAASSDALTASDLAATAPGVFTVDESGQLSIDYLFDGGGYRQGELALFNLEGMEDLSPDSLDYVQGSCPSCPQQQLNRDMWSSQIAAKELASRGQWLEKATSVRVTTRAAKPSACERAIATALCWFPTTRCANCSSPTFRSIASCVLSFPCPLPITTMGAIASKWLISLGMVTPLPLKICSWTAPQIGDYNDLIFQVLGSRARAASLGDTVAAHRVWYDSTLGQQIVAYANGQIVDRPTTAPTVAVTLANDTGSSNQDRITLDPALLGHISSSHPATRLQASLNDSDALTDITPLLQNDGSFALDEAQLAALNGTLSLNDAEHTLFIQATDAQGNSSEIVTFHFTLDTTPPDLAVELSPASDTDPISDGQTEFSRVTLVGQSEPHAQVKLLDRDVSTTADESGRFELNEVALVLGSNPFTLEATDPSGNQSRHSESFIRLEPAEGIQLEADGNTTVEETYRFQVPENPTVLSFEVAALNLENGHGVNPVFEAALVDRDGHSLVQTIAANTDVFFNIADEGSPTLAAGVSFTHQTVAIDLSPGASRQRREAGVAVGQC